MTAAESGTRPAHATSDGDLLKLLLVDRDIGCGRCGYNLRGVATAACPECGEPLALPTMLPPTTGYGPGSLLVWMLPLAMGLVVVVGLIHEIGDDFGRVAILVSGLCALIVMPVIMLTVIGVMGRRRVISLKNLHRYWNGAVFVIVVYTLVFLLIALGFIMD